jgi:hypothetical protein
MTRRRSSQTSAEVRTPGGHGRKGQPIRDRALAALLSAPSIAAAAAVAGIHEKTLRAWLKTDAPFQAAYTESREAVFSAALGRVLVLSETAVATLEGLLHDTQPPAVRFSAAKALVEIGLHQRDAAAILQRLDELDAQAVTRKE